MSKTKKRQSRRLNQNISVDSNAGEVNIEITQSNRTREGRNVQENFPPESEIQSMIESAVARALSDHGVNINDQSKKSQ